MQCSLLTENVEALKNVIEDEPYFFTEIVNNDLRELIMITKHFMSEHGKGIIVSQRQKLLWQMWKSGDGVGWRRWTWRGGRNLAGVALENGRVEGVAREDCLDGCDGAGSGEVKGGGVDLGVVNIFLGEIPRDVMRERGRDTIGVDGGAVWYSRWAKISFDTEERWNEG
ncbi:hypothetical protein Tco_0477290 [Tanacetum coccineum]